MRSAWLEMLNGTRLALRYPSSPREFLWTLRASCFTRQKIDSCPALCYNSLISQGDTHHLLLEPKGWLQK